MCGVKCAERGGRPRKAGVVPKGLQRPGRRKPGPGAPPQGTGGAGLIKEGRKVGGGGGEAGRAWPPQGTPTLAGTTDKR